MTRKMILIPLFLAGALTVAVFLGLRASSVSAQSGTGEPTVNNERFAPVLSCYNGEHLAGALGISIEELEEAQSVAFQAALDLAVEQDLITRAQADSLLERGGRGMPSIWNNWLERSGIDYQALLAEALGISVDELEEAIETARQAALEDARANSLGPGGDPEVSLGLEALFNDGQFQATMQSAFEEAVNQAVEDGVITRSQADAILESFGEGFGMPGMLFRRMESEPEAGFGSGRMFMHGMPGIHHRMIVEDIIPERMPSP